MEDMKKKARIGMLKELSKEMADGQYGDLKEKMAGKQLNKVTVMSDSPEGLKKGLSKAEEIMKKKSELMGESEDSDEEMEDEAEEMEQEEPSEMEDESPEAIQAKIEELKAKLAKLS